MQSYKELLAQRESLDAQIESMRKTEMGDAIAKVRALISEFGLTEGDIFGRTAKKVRESKPVAPKYRNPETGVTWTGRGKPPVWIAGKDREAFLIT